MGRIKPCGNVPVSITWPFCQAIFRNSARIRRIVICSEGACAFIEFATHSATRKAIQRCMGHSLVHVRWARPEVRTATLSRAGASSDFGDVACIKLETLLLAADAEPNYGTTSPEVIQLPHGCYSPSDVEVFHLLPST